MSVRTSLWQRFGALPVGEKASRRDIQGLRGFAVLLVLIAHAGVPGFGGGFLGVDVFFVVSGFLITGLLVREVRNTGTVSIAGFYARRARRILPAATVLLVVTVGIAALFQTLPIENQPPATTAFAEVGHFLARYVSGKSESVYHTLVVLSSALVLLACVPLFNALRSSGPRWLAAALLAPLALIAVVHFQPSAAYALGRWQWFGGNAPGFYFEPFILTYGWGGFIDAWLVVFEWIKWVCVCLIALWLTVAQVFSWRGRSDA